MRFAFIQRHRGRWPVTLMCRLLAVSRSGYYAWVQRPASQQALRRRRLTKLIQIVHAESDATYGSPRVHRELLALGQRCCVNFVAKLMRLAGVAAKSTRKFKRRPTRRTILRLPTTCCSETSKRSVPTRSGSATSPTSRRGKDGCTWPWLKTSTRAASSGGP